jgi:GT2 family glycosyltransferase
VFCSTIIPTIGRASLARSVSSVLEQRLPAGELEVIVVNDSGRPLAAADWQTSPRVRQIETRQRGQSVARNAGAALARGRYLHFLDDDDWLLPEALASFWELAQRAPQADWLYGGLRVLDRDGRRLSEFNPGLAGNAHIQLMSGVWVTPVASLIRASAFFAVGGFAPALRIGEEIDLGRQLTRRGDLAYTAAVVVCVERGHGGHASMANAPSAAEANRWSRDRALAMPGTFGRLRGSAHTPYWRGRLLQAYLAAAHWNWRHGRYAASASRCAWAMLSLTLAGPALLTRPYWQALRDEHVPNSSLRVLSTLIHSEE